MNKYISLFLLCTIVAPSILFATPVCKTHRHLFFENKNAKVWKTIICPHKRLPFHTHTTARILISKENGTLEVLYKTGKKEIVNLVRNVPAYLPVAEGIKLHQDINIGSRPMHLTVISLKNSK